MTKQTASGHITALITVLIWGTTFISTKILLTEFTPTEILFFRFMLGLIVLIIAYPKRLKTKNVKEELTFAAAGLCGICLYYLLENIALTYTLASNVGVIISVAPFFTAILSRIFMKSEEKLKANFFIGFLAAMAGICLISFGGSEPELNPIGDILAVIAALVWAVYSLLTRKISGFGYNTVQSTRRIFIYGIIFMLPSLFVFDFSPDFGLLAKPEYILNLLYLGIGASALCFVTWNYAVKVLGAVKTSVYIYMVPVITVVTSAIVLKEKLTAASVAGTLLTMAGLFLSQRRKMGNP
jgi:drug/metabolite transporter (DMT)-like permease